jgi:hypothetical protein
LFAVHRATWRREHHVLDGAASPQVSPTSPPPSSLSAGVGVGVEAGFGESGVCEAGLTCNAVGLCE